MKNNAIYNTIYKRKEKAVYHYGSIALLIMPNRKQERRYEQNRQKR